MTRLPTAPSPSTARNRGNDRGRVSVFLAVAITGLLMVLGVAVDGTGQLRSLLRAQNLAAEAARAAGQAIDGPQAVLGNQVVADAGLAAQYADQYLDQAFANLDQGFERHPIELADGGAAVRVTVTLIYDTQVLGLFGTSEIAVTASSTADLVIG